MVVVLLQAETSDLRELCRIAGGDPATFYRGINLDELELSDGDREYFQQGMVVELIGKVRGAVRQEERISLLINQILKDRKVGISALDQYSDERAKFARDAISLIRQQFNSKDHDTSNDQLIVAKIIPKLFKEIYPYNRGALLYFLAKHIGTYPIINSVISSCLNKTASIYVDRVRPEIESILSHAVYAGEAMLNDGSIDAVSNKYDSNGVEK